MQGIQKKPHILATAFALAMVFALAAVGCSSAGEQVDEAADNRAYMSQANTAMMQLNADLVPFDEAVAAGDIVTMEQAAAAAYRDIDAFKDISAPETMKDIHEAYKAGCDDLAQALQAYVQLYRDAADLDDAAFNNRIASIKETYDSGIAHLQEGDKLVTELDGALPSESSSSTEG